MQRKVTRLIGKAMRKYGYIICALLAVCFNACQAQLEEVFSDEPGLTVLTATTGADTKSSISPMEDGISGILWSEYDVLAVFIDGAPQPTAFSLSEGAGTKRASFTGYGRGESYVGFYPFGSVEALDGETVRVNLPAEQAYVSGSFGEGSYPMVAVSSSDELSFKAVSSVLKLSLTGHHTVTGIVFRSNDPGVKVCGPATVSLANPAAPVIEMSPEGLDSLVINTGGVILDSEEASDFYFVLPAQNYKGGFTVRVYTTTGYMDKPYGSDFRMERSKVHPAAAKVVLTSGMETSASLEGYGTEEDPFLISSLEDLMLMRESVNTKDGVIKRVDGISVTASLAHYLLTKDLDLSPLCGKEAGKNWTPIGLVNEDCPFQGTFDGGGHKVTNLYLEERYSFNMGFFGYLTKATIRNLTVSGEVNAPGDCGLIGGFVANSIFENCISKGSVKSEYDNVGGLIGMARRTEIYYCSNEADISGGSYVGGLVGDSDFGCYVLYSTNKGKVKGSTEKIGGLTGWLNGSKYINCVNYGSVEGDTRVGGIAGEPYQGGKALNCVNYGDVKGKDFVGGLAGYVSCIATAYQGAATVANSINFANVSMIGGRYAGMIAGFLGVTDGEEPMPGEPADAAWAKNNYWLANNDGLYAVGGGPGIASDNCALTDAQMKGAPYDGVLYFVPRGQIGYNTLIDALNAGAVEWARNTMNVRGGDNRDHFYLSGWEYPSAGSYPVHTDLEAQMPGENKPVFELSDGEFNFIVKGGRFVVEVTSNYGYSVASLPSWIRAGEVKEKEQRPHTHLHYFTVTENKSGEERKGFIVFENSEGKTSKVKVTQEAPYLEVKTTEFSAPAVGGSKSVQVSSSVDWVAVTECDWMKVTPRYGTGDGNVSILLDRNKLSNAREGQVVITSTDGSIKHTVNLVQSGNSGGEVGNWEELPFYHQSLVFRFTATWCVWCPYMNKAVIRAQELYPGKIQQLAMHCGGSDLQFDPAQTLMNQFNSNAFPTGIVDGRIRVSNGEDYESFAPEYVAAAKETEEVYGTSSGLALRSALSGQRATIDVDAYFKTAGDYKITVVLVEDGIIHYQENGGDDYQHDNIVRATATDILGDGFKISRGMSRRTFSYVVPIPEDAVLGNLRVFAYIQKGFGSAPRIQTEAVYGDYYVDNCATAPLGESLKLRLVGDDGGGGGSGSGNEEIETGDEIR